MFDAARGPLANVSQNSKIAHSGRISPAMCAARRVTLSYDFHKVAIVKSLDRNQETLVAVFTDPKALLACKLTFLQ